MGGPAPLPLALTSQAYPSVNCIACHKHYQPTARLEKQPAAALRQESLECLYTESCAGPVLQAVSNWKTQ